LPFALTTSIIQTRPLLKTGRETRYLQPFQNPFTASLKKVLLDSRRNQKRRPSKRFELEFPGSFISPLPL